MLYVGPGQQSVFFYCVCYDRGNFPKKTARPAWNRTSRVAHYSFQPLRLTIVEGRAIGLWHRRCDGRVGGRRGTAGRLASTGGFTTASWRSITPAVHRRACGVTTRLACSADQIIRAMMVGAKHTAVRYLGNAHLGGFFAAATSGPASLYMRPADLLVVLHLRAAL